MKDCLSQLFNKFSITSLLVEGGAQVIQSFLEADLVDEAVIFIKPIFAGGYRSLTSELSTYKDLTEVVIGESGGDIVLHGKVR
jgi:diaminohydroxyphosphoribosylaminopyrimidine deaminase/5-amino-6-(5-phosphoribosylamino)uracil reductase